VATGSLSEISEDFDSDNVTPDRIDDMKFPLLFQFCLEKQFSYRIDFIY
jgi:hypothetical protein